MSALSGAGASRRILAAALGLAAALALGVCTRSGDGSIPAGSGDPRHPPGTVLAVEGQPILLAEVEEALPWVERVTPGSTSPQLLRLALTNFGLPRAIGRALAEPGARERALAEAQAQLGRLRKGEAEPAGPDGAQGTRAEGGFKLLGLQVWGLALDLPPGEWSDVHEGPGHFVLVRRLASTPAPVPAAMEFAVDIFTFPYIGEDEPAAQIEQAYDRLRLEIVDPAWREIVPELIQYRMGAR